MLHWSKIFRVKSGNVPGSIELCMAVSFHVFSICFCDLLNHVNFVQTVRDFQELTGRQLQKLDCFCRDQWHAPEGYDASKEGIDFKYYPLTPECGGVVCAAPAPGHTIASSAE